MDFFHVPDSSRLCEVSALVTNGENPDSRMFELDAPVQCRWIPALSIASSLVSNCTSSGKTLRRVRAPSLGAGSVPTNRVFAEFRLYLLTHHCSLAILSAKDDLDVAVPVQANGFV